MNFSELLVFNSALTERENLSETSVFNSALTEELIPQKLWIFLTVSYNPLSCAIFLIDDYILRKDQ